MAGWKTRPWFIPIVLTVVLLIGSFFYFQTQTSGEEKMTPADIQEQLERMYGGTVTQLELVQNDYVAQLEKEDGLYEVRANSNYGTVVSIVRTEEREVATVETPESEPVEQQPEEQPESTPAEAPTRLTEAEVSEIAKQQVAGEVEDVDFEQSESGGYYLVEIEQPSQGDDDGPEATVQIHAITGEVLSVVWDD